MAPVAEAPLCAGGAGDNDVVILQFFNDQTGDHGSELDTTAGVIPNAEGGVDLVGGRGPEEAVRVKGLRVGEMVWVQVTFGDTNADKPAFREKEVLEFEFLSGFSVKELTAGEAKCFFDNAGRESGVLLFTDLVEPLRIAAKEFEYPDKQTGGIVGRDAEGKEQVVDDGVVEGTVKLLGQLRDRRNRLGWIAEHGAQIVEGSEARCAQTLRHGFVRHSRIR